MTVQTKCEIRAPRCDFLLLIGTLVIMMCVVARPASADNVHKPTAKQAWANYSAAQKAWQEGLSRFANFDWTDADNEALLADKNYAALEATVADLEKKNSSQKNWEAFRTYFRERLSQDAEYMALFGEFMRRRAEVEALLKELRG